MKKKLPAQIKKKPIIQANMMNNIDLEEEQIPYQMNQVNMEQNIDIDFGYG